MKKIKFFDLPFWQNIMRLSEAMQYSLSDYNALTEKSSDYQKSNHYYWIAQIASCADKQTCEQITKFKEENLEALNSNPILLGLLEVFEKASKANSEEEYKEIYDAFQEVQKAYPFDSNAENYFDAGCQLTKPYLDDKSDKILVSYPITLYTAYTAHGGRDDDHRGGHLFPVHELDVEKLTELYNSHPELFEGKVEEIYLKIIKNRD